MLYIYLSSLLPYERLQLKRQLLALMLDKEAIIQVTSTEELKQQLIKLLSDDNYRTTLKNNTAKLSGDTRKILDDYTALILSGLTTKN